MIDPSMPSNLASDAGKEWLTIYHPSIITTEETSKTKNVYECIDRLLSDEEDSDEDDEPATKRPKLESIIAQQYNLSTRREWSERKRKRSKRWYT